ncbi:DUF2637 domain-containing protein [Streptomyces sp. NPDC101152]|uniref:DUF2637 domain-containing protein n=1 Tax=Streptomyces sp. NPDC101152 TaxID=3366116 RepID=UPI0038193B96
MHQREFALQGGADAVSATLWPLSVDGLLLLATVGLLAPARSVGCRARVVVWLAFLLGIAVSLAANIAAAPALAWKPMLVAGWPPVALLLSVELLAHRFGRRDRDESVRHSSTPSGDRERDGGVKGSRDETEDARREQDSGNRDETRSGRQEASENGRESAGVGEREKQALLSQGVRPRSAGISAEDVMWEHFQRQLAAGHMASGAELDRVAGTNNYGRAVLARWRRVGRIPSTVDRAHVNGSRGRP